MDVWTEGKVNKQLFASKSVYPEGGRACYFYTHFFCCVQYARVHPVYKRPGLMAGVMKNHLVKWYFFASDDDLALILGRFYEDLSELEAMEKYLITNTQKGVHLIGDISKIQESPSETLKDIFKTYFEYYWHLMTTAGLLRMLDRAVIKSLRGAFTGKDSADDLIAIAGIPAKPSFATQERLAILALSKEVAVKKLSFESVEVKKAISNICATYASGVMGYFDEKPWVESDYVRFVTEAILGNPEVEELELLAKISSEEESREQLLSSLDDRAKKLVHIASWAAYLKDLYKASINKLEYVAEPLFLELSRCSGLETDFIKDLSLSEMLDLVDGKTPDEALVRARANYNVIAGDENNIEVFTGETATQFENEYLKKERVGQTEFKGRVASRGYGKGVAKIVRSVSEFGKLNEGDVLVVTNTSPDFVSIMKKAAAIIAEDGGITAHVSVVSREFGIPAVTGVFDATDVIRDGDFVEVDAEKGIVKILKRF